MDDSFAQFRTLLSQAPTQARAQTIFSLIAKLPAEEQSIAIDYVEEHLDAWPTYVRRDEQGLVEECPALERLFAQAASLRVEEMLQRCLEALQSGDMPRAFDWSLSAWKSERSEEIAALVEAIDAQLPGLVFSNKKRAQQQEWLSYAATGDARLIGALWRSLYEKRTISEVKARVNALAAWGDDPRSGTHFLLLASGVPWTSNGSRSVWRPLFLMFDGSLDRRLLALEGCPIGWDFRPPMVEYLSRQIGKILPTIAIAPVVTLGEEASRLCRECMGSLQVDNVDPVSLAWQALAEAPADAARRETLIAAWEEDEDPRARWTSLRAQKKRSKAENAEAKALKSQYEATWLGELGVVLNKGAKYKDGFLDAVKIRRRSGAGLKGVAVDPLWCTVRSIECYIADLEAIGGIETLSSLEHLVLKGHDRDEAPEKIEAYERLSSLFWRHQLKTIQLSLGWLPFDFVDLALAVSCHIEAKTYQSLRSFSIKTHHCHVLFEREAEERVALHIKSAAQLEAIEQLLFDMPKELLTSFVWEAHQEMKGMARALAAHTKLQQAHSPDAP